MPTTVLALSRPERLESGRSGLGRAGSRPVGQDPVVLAGKGPDPGHPARIQPSCPGKGRIPSNRPALSISVTLSVFVTVSVFICRPEERRRRRRTREKKNEREREREKNKKKKKKKKNERERKDFKKEKKIMMWNFHVRVWGFGCGN
jgi:hypothetical protein